MALAEWEDMEEGKEIMQQWEDDWDDDDVNDDFSLQLRRELESNTEKKNWAKNRFFVVICSSASMAICFPNSLSVSLLNFLFWQILYEFGLHSWSLCSRSSELTVWNAFVSYVLFSVFKCWMFWFFKVIDELCLELVGVGLVKKSAIRMTKVASRAGPLWASIGCIGRQIRYM